MKISVREISVWGGKKLQAFQGGGGGCPKKIRPKGKKDPARQGVKNRPG